MLLEFNARFGDPECQALMMRLMSDPLPALIAARDGVLRSGRSALARRDRALRRMAAHGYPDEPQRGSEIRGLEALAATQGQDLPRRHAPRPRGRLIADGGRVLGVTALGGEHRRRASAPTPRSTASTGRKASAAATSAPGIDAPAGPRKRQRENRHSGVVSGEPETAIGWPRACEKGRRRPE